MPQTPKPERSSRMYPARPIACVGALVVRGGEILLIKRRKPPKAGDWSLPGGAVKTGETIEDALKREVWEECGLKITPIKLLDVVDYIVPAKQPAVDADTAPSPSTVIRTETSSETSSGLTALGPAEYHYILIDWLAVADDPTASPKASSDALESVFMPFSEAMARVTWRETKRLILKAQEEAERAAFG